MKGWFGNSQKHSLASKGVKTRKLMKSADKEKGQKTYYVIWYDGVVEQFSTKKKAIQEAKELIKEGKDVEVTKVCTSYKDWGWNTYREEWVIDIDTGEIGEYIGDN